MPYRALFALYSYPVLAIVIPKEQPVVRFALASSSSNDTGIRDARSRQVPTQPPAVIGVSAPGLGEGGCSGLNNQIDQLFGLVLLALENKAVISVASLNFRVSYADPNTYVGFEELFDFEAWQREARRSGVLPELTRAQAAASYNAAHLWGTNEEYVSAIRRDPAMERLPAELAMMKHGLVPSARVAAAIQSLRPREPYGAVHVRLEKDLRMNGDMQAYRVPLPTLYGWLRSLQPDISLGIRSLFLAVSRPDVDDMESAALIDGGQSPWVSIPSFTAGVAAAEAHGFNTSAHIVGAIIDQAICTAAAFFVGTSMSTFSNNVVTARGAHDNFDYGPKGLNTRTDDGRLVWQHR